MKKITIVLALFIISIVCCAGCIDPQEPVVPVDPVDPITPIEPVEPVVPVVPVEEYSVLFMMNYDDAGAYAAETVTAGDTVSKPASPSRSGYTFTGWFTAADGGVVYDFTQPVNADTMLYAQWKEEERKSSGSSHSHNWGDGVETTAPTCGETGVKTFTCSCGKTKTEDISATGDHTYVVEEVEGRAGALCSVCNNFKPFVDNAVIMTADGNSYASVSDAMDAVDSGDKITLLSNPNEGVSVEEDVIIDCNGQEATLVYPENTDGDSIKILKDGYDSTKVTVKIGSKTATFEDFTPVTFALRSSGEGDVSSTEDEKYLTIAYAKDSENHLYDVYTAYGLVDFKQIIDEQSWNVVLMNDIDLSEVTTHGNSFAPLGFTGKYGDEFQSNGVTYRPLETEPFKGTFDGQGYAIKNLYQSGWDLGYMWGHYGSIGLFSQLEDATVKNVVLEGFECCVEGGDISFIAGSATGDCTFENITIKNGKIGTYNNGIGGIIGWSGAGTYTFKNITIGEDVVIGGLWGSFDSSVGGIVGQAEPGATYNFDNVDIACRLDVYNDCTASYDYYNYRMCGMIIGRLEKTTTIDRSNYPDMSKYYITCKDVTVTYGEWANYHYCEPTPADMNGGRGMRVEPGYEYDGLPADYDHSQCVDNHMNMISFDQLFGGDQINVKGLKEYAGVTVVYPEEYTCPLCDIPHNTS